jgi:hypothetical protein
MSRERMRIIAWATASFVFGLVLIYQGVERNLFQGEGRHFAMGVFLIVWLVVVGVLGLYFKDNPPRNPFRGDD